MAHGKRKSRHPDFIKTKDGGDYDYRAHKDLPRSSQAGDARRAENCLTRQGAFLALCFSQRDLVGLALPCEVVDAFVVWFSRLHLK